jgi:hypothetical protein
VKLRHLGAFGEAGAGDELAEVPGQDYLEEVFKLVMRLIDSI